MWHAYWSSSSSLPNMKTVHWRIKVTYNFEKRVNQKVNLGRCPMPVCPDIAILKDRFLKNPSKNVSLPVSESEGSDHCPVTESPVIIVDLSMNSKDPEKTTNVQNHRMSLHIWASTRQNLQNSMCAQQRLRSAWASAQSDQSLAVCIKKTLGP